MAAFPGPAWASLLPPPAERLGLAEPGVLCLSQPCLPLPRLPALHLSQLSAQALLGTHLAAAWNAGIGCGKCLPCMSLLEPQFPQ